MHNAFLSFTFVPLYHQESRQTASLKRLLYPMFFFAALKVSYNIPKQILHFVDQSVNKNRMLYLENLSVLRN